MQSSTSRLLASLGVCGNSVRCSKTDDKEQQQQQHSRVFSQTQPPRPGEIIDLYANKTSRLQGRPFLAAAAAAAEKELQRQQDCQLLPGSVLARSLTERGRARWGEEESRTFVIIERRNLREQLRRCEHLEEAELKPDPFAVARTH